MTDGEFMNVGTNYESDIWTACEGLNHLYRPLHNRQRDVENSPPTITEIQSGSVPSSLTNQPNQQTSLI